MSESRFLAEWRAWLTRGGSGLRLASETHPLEIFVGSNDLGAAKLAIQTTTKPKEPKLSDLVLVDRQESKAGYWFLSLTLQDKKFQEVFLRLADDLFARSGVAGAEDAALRIVDTVFDEWRRLLRPPLPGVLSKEELRGLVGEMWILLHRFASEHPIDEAIAGWLGPLDAHQDFFYESSRLHEVKAVGPTMSAIRISSEYQLDPMDEDLELIVLQVADVAEGAEGAVNLLVLVDQVRQLLDEAASDFGELEVRLSHLGVDLKHKYYAESWFAMSSLSTFVVLPDFPAIRASTLPEGVKQVFYRLELGAIEKFKTHHELLG